MESRQKLQAAVNVIRDWLHAQLYIFFELSRRTSMQSSRTESQSRRFQFMNVPTVSASSPAQAAMVAVLQEATETAAQTKLEAGRGDPQAVAKLAKLTAQQVARQAAPSIPPDGTGKVVNLKV
jgi:hypothetical protein